MDKNGYLRREGLLGVVIPTQPSIVGLKAVRVPAERKRSGGECLSWIVAGEVCWAVP